MSEAIDTIKEAVEQAEQNTKNRINSAVAVLVAITATFMAICNVKDGNIVQAMSQAQAHAIDEWGYYQAKSTKQALAESTLEILKSQNSTSNAALIKKYEDRVLKYEKEKAEIKKQAEAYTKEYDDINLFDDQFDMTDALLTIAIAMYGISSLTQKKWLLYFAASITLLGLVFGMAAFFKISLHSDFVARILG